MAKSPDVNNVIDNVSEQNLLEMCTPEFTSDFTCLLKTRYPLMYLVAKEENRVDQYLKYFCKARGYDCYIWDTFHGLINLLTETVEGGSGSSNGFKSNPMGMLEYIIEYGKNEMDEQTISTKKQNGVNGTIFVLKDFFRFIEENPEIERRLKAIASMQSVVSTVMVAPSYKSTDVLTDLIQVVDFPLPNRKEIKHALYFVIKGVEKKLLEYGVDILKKTKEQEEQLINSVTGLTLLEAQTAFSKSIVLKKDWDIPNILREKKQIISKSGMLEFHDNTIGLDQIGGLKNLTNWIKKRKSCFSEEAEKYGLKKPRGLMILGLPGGGKSLSCKAISQYWEMPLLRLDFGKMFSSLVGSSEKNIRDALHLSEVIAPCILWIDEIEKGISGGNSSGQTDGGTTSRVLSTFLTWMQEKKSSVFVVATANNHESIPPEFLRAGRFDEIFFVDFPNYDERKEIYEIILKRNNLKLKNFNLDDLARNSDTYSGAEIEKSIDNAMLTGFSEDKREIGTMDIINSLKAFKPLYEMRKEDFDALREWALERAIKANANCKEKVILNNPSAPKKLDV